MQRITRAIWATVLAIALLLAPCASLTDLFGAGGGHAHAAAFDSGHESGHLSHGGAEHSTPAHHAPGHADPAPHICCQSCDVWLSRRAGDMPSAMLRAADPEAPSVKLVAALAPDVRGSRQAARRTAPLADSGGPPPSGARIYLLTQRFRI